MALVFTALLTLVCSSRRRPHSHKRRLVGVRAGWWRSWHILVASCPLRTKAGQMRLVSVRYRCPQQAGLVSLCRRSLAVSSRPDSRWLEVGAMVRTPRETVVPSVDFVVLSERPTVAVTGSIVQ